MTHVHEEEYSKGHVALYCYDDGFNVGPLPKAQAWDQMRMHLMLEHGESLDVGFRKVPHSKVERAYSGKGVRVPKVKKQGGFVGNDIFPDTAISYPELGHAVPKYKNGPTSIFDFNFDVSGLPDYGNFL